jgi:MinD-like ATPase involved in chromosome partitioning or flagellar assembly
LTTGTVLVALTATKAPWSTNFREYCREHTTDLSVEVIVNVRALLHPAHRQYDVLVIDDMMRLVGVGDVAAAQDRQVHVLGLTDPTQGLGRKFLEDLRVDQIALASLAPSELADLVRSVGPQNARIEPAQRPLARHPRPGAPRAQGSLTAFTPASGGTGLSETLVAVAEILARQRQKVLVVEADEIAPVLASRLRRSPGTGLPSALARAQQHRAVFPEGLTGGRDDGTPPLGSFDVICGISAPGGPLPVNPVELTDLLEQALAVYDNVLVDTGPWLTRTAQTGRDRLNAPRPALALARHALVFARATPDGATQLVEWRSVAHDNGLQIPVLAVFGRATGTYEQSHLAYMLEVNTNWPHSFAGVQFLPEDARVAKARWNAELVTQGRWWRSVEGLVRAMTGPLPELVVAPVLDGRESFATPAGAGV